MEELLTADDVCRWLRIRKSKLYALTHERRLPFYKVGNHLRFRRCEIEEWLSGLRASDVSDASPGRR